MSRARTVSVGIAALLLLIFVPILGAADQDDPPLQDSFDQLVVGARDLAAGGKYAEALRKLISACEAHPDVLDHNGYEALLREACEWFGRMPIDQRPAFLLAYETHPDQWPNPAGAPFAQLLTWVDVLLPATTLRTSEAMLIVAGCHRQLRNAGRYASYALAAYEKNPKNVAAEHAIQRLMTWQYYDLDREGMVRTAQVAAKIDPAGWPAAWAVCRAAIHLSACKRLDDVKAFCAQIRQTAGATAAGEAAERFGNLVRDVETEAYSRAFDRLWGLRVHFFDETPGGDVLETLCITIDWRRWFEDVGIQERIDRLMAAARNEVDRPGDVGRRACAQLILGHCCQRTARNKEAIEWYERAADSGVNAAVEHALGQLGQLLILVDHRRAIECLERQRDRYIAHPDGYERPLKQLGMLYCGTGRHAEALAILDELDRRSRTGQLLVGVGGDDLVGRKIQCLRGLGRSAEADALASPILRKYRYGTPIDQLADEELGNLYAIITDMGMRTEAAPLKQELLRRAEENRPRE
ncbi:MAG: hypothetical protein JXQ73_29995 [Phycisphaerae bacterium]|nr:hypothetical protein [Phycisphaerae bacterium]